MVIDISNIKSLGALLTKGLSLKYAPGIIQNALKAYFKNQNMDVPKTTAWVQENKSLWDNIGPERQRQIKLVAKRLGSIDFLTADWAIEGLKEDFPAVASLFLGWTKARNWLERQLGTIREQSLPK